jgi:DNA invertase Pin-like site-specific DNA recombinase
MGVFRSLKTVGSAFTKGSQKDIKDLLKSCKNKLLVVHSADRLSRNLNNFKEIYEICKKNKHNIAIVNMNQIYDMQNRSNYEIIMTMIRRAYQESADIGARISRTMRYKKSREVPFGKMRDENDRVVPNPFELKIIRLIKLLGTAGSSVDEIRTLISEVGKTEGKEPFELEEYGGEANVDITTRLPYAMWPSNIEETLKIYEVRHRRARWSSLNIRRVLADVQINRTQVSVDEISDDFAGAINFRVRETVQPVATSSNTREFICIWYDPAFGLPPNITLPAGMSLPSTACQLYIPRV